MLQLCLSRVRTHRSMLRASHEEPDRAGLCHLVSLKVHQTTRHTCSRTISSLQQVVSITLRCRTAMVTLISIHAKLQNNRNVHDHCQVVLPKIYTMAQGFQVTELLPSAALRQGKAISELLTSLCPSGFLSVYLSGPGLLKIALSRMCKLQTGC